MTDPFAQLLDRLTEQARLLAQARAKAMAAPPAARWRKPALLWPLFTKG